MIPEAVSIEATNVFNRNKKRVARARSVLSPTVACQCAHCNSQQSNKNCAANLT